MKKIYFFLVLALFYITGNAQTVTTFTLNSGVTSTTLTAPMAPGDSIILRKGMLPPNCTVAIVSYTTVVAFNNVHDSVFCVIGNMLNDNNQFTMESYSTVASIYVISWAMIGMNLVCYDSNGTPVLYWLITNSNLTTSVSESSNEYYPPKIYPNPINEAFTIDIKNQNASSFEFKIYNNIGELVKQENDVITSEANNINISNLLPGIYTLEIICDNKKSLQKIVKM
jgi:hypothetical protein